MACWTSVPMVSHDVAQVRLFLQSTERAPTSALGPEPLERAVTRMEPTSNASDTSRPVVLITGALTGIGRATARAFARDGYRLVISGRRDDAGAALSAELQ